MGLRRGSPSAAGPRTASWERFATSWRKALARSVPRRPTSSAGDQPRARHDAGLEPVDWLRVALILVLVAVASGSALVTAGLLRQGPLADLGWRERQLKAVGVTPSRPVDRSLHVAVMLPASNCADVVAIDVEETEHSVVVGPVRARESRFGQTPCQPQVRPGQRALARVTLEAPLRDRRLLRAGDLQPLPSIG